MLWLIIFFSVIGFFVYNHIKHIHSSRENLRKEIDTQGGMATKYHTLIDTLLFTKDARVSELNRDSIKLIANYETNTFLITPFGSGVRIVCKTNGNMGEATKLWNFSRHLDQEAMGIRVLREMNSERANTLAEKKLIDYENRNPQVAQQMMAEFKAIPKRPLRETIEGFDEDDYLYEGMAIPPTPKPSQKAYTVDTDVFIKCDICNDRGYTYVCGRCGGDIYFTMQYDEAYEFCKNCSDKHAVDVQTEPCPCKEF